VSADWKEGATSGALLVHRIRPSWIPVPHDDGAISSGTEVLASFAPDLLSLDQLKSLSHDPRLSGKSIWGGDAPVMMQTMVAAVPLIRALPNAFANVLQVGYFVCDRQLFVDVMNDLLPDVRPWIVDVFPGTEIPIDGASYLTTVEALRASPEHSLYGSPIRRDGNYLFVDLYAATQRLESAFTFPKLQGDEANARGDHFEDAVQELIDQTGWKPSGDLRSMQRRALRLNGQKITDLDAVGERNGVLLGVSCKSRIYSAEYHAGEYQAVRNAAQGIEEAVTHATRIGELLLQHPRGDNYDFSAYSQVIVPVVTPITVYVPIGAATGFLIGKLRAASSIAEFDEFLREASERH
jgi:hypothetical protein